MASVSNANGEVIEIEYEGVLGMSQGFAIAQEVLSGIRQTLEVVVKALEVADFMGIAGAKMLVAYLENIIPRLEKLSATSAELSKDLKDTVDWYEGTETQVKPRFAH
jgi:hypothetical protein